VRLVRKANPYQLLDFGFLHDGGAMITPEQIAEWKALCEKKVCQFCLGEPDHKCGDGHACGTCCGMLGELTGTPAYAWVDGIIAKHAAARTALPALLEAYEALLLENAEAQKVILELVEQRKERAKAVDSFLADAKRETAEKCVEIASAKEAEWRTMGGVGETCQMYMNAARVLGKAIRSEFKLEIG
jgi:hypothetical protein